MKIQKLEEYINVADITSQFMKENDGDVAKAAIALEAAAKSNTGLWIALTSKLLGQACYDACRAVCKTERRKIWTTVDHTKGGSTGGHGSRVKTHATTLLDWPLPGGKPMREATKADLINAAAFYSKQAGTMRNVSLWLTKISTKVGTSTVGKVLTSDQLETLRASSVKKAA